MDGGTAMNHLLLQMQADLLGVPVGSPAVTETTALGAGYLAGLAVGVWKCTADLSSQRRLDRRFEPQLLPGKSAALREEWSRAVGCARQRVAERH